MSEIQLKVKPLTPEAFAPYGDVLEVSEGNDKFQINQGLTTRHHALARVDASDLEGEPVISLFRTQGIKLPFRLKLMERHPLGSQAFFPLSCNLYLVVVAGEGEFDSSKIEVFLARPGQGVSYRKGVWHHYNLVLNGSGDFLVIDRDGAGNNCEEVEIPSDIEVTICHKLSGMEIEPPA